MREEFEKLGIFPAHLNISLYCSKCSLLRRSWEIFAFLLSQRVKVPGFFFFLFVTARGLLSRQWYIFKVCDLFLAEHVRSSSINQFLLS